MSGKFGWLIIRGTNSSQETTVVTDSNLPLAGPYTSKPKNTSNCYCEFYASPCLVLGRSIAIHSDETPSEIIACANIEPDVISDITVQLTFPIPADNGIDVR